MRLKKGLLILFVFSWFLFFSNGLVAQSDPKLSVFSFNPIRFNPAFAGAGGGLSAIAIHSTQFGGFDGAPSTQYLSVHGLFEEQQVGVGIDFIHDRFGITQESGVFGNFSYYLRLGETLNLSFGIKAGVDQLKMDLGQLNASNPDEDALYELEGNNLAPVVGAGMYLFTEQVYFGVSAPSLLGRDQKLPFKTSFHPFDSEFYLMGGIIVPLSYNLFLRPNVLARMVRGAPTSYLSSIILDISGYSFFGINWEYKSSIGATGGLLLGEQVKVGYAFDFPTGSLGRHSLGTHTFFVSFNLDHFKRASSMPCFYY